MSETVVVKGMKKFSKDTVGLVAVSLSRNFGLVLISHVSFPKHVLAVSGGRYADAIAERSDLPWNMIEPQWMTREQLRRPRCDPVRKPVIVLLRGLNLPAHDEEHDEDDGDLLGFTADVWEGS